LCYSFVLASAKIAVPDSGSRTEKGPAGGSLGIDSKPTSELKTQEKYIPEEGLVSSKCIRFCFLCTVFMSDKQ
jgi:hypothetical protein